MATLKPDEETLRKYFRLDLPPSELFQNEEDEIDCTESSLDVKEEDLSAMVDHLPQLSQDDYDAWYGLFLGEESVEFSYEISIDHSFILFRYFLEILTEYFEYGYRRPLWEQRLKALWTLIMQDDSSDPDWSVLPARRRSELLRWLYEQAQAEGSPEGYSELYASLLEYLYSIDDKSGLYAYADAYYGGNFLVPCDWKKAEQAYLKLDAMGDEFAADPLGYIYYSKRLGEPDYEKAFFFFNKAYHAGNQEAIYKLSDMYRKGHGTAQNLQKSWALLNKAYERGLELERMSEVDSKLADILLRMGYFAEDGLIQRANPLKACELYLAAKAEISHRLENWDCFGDKVVDRNIDTALARCLQKIDLKDHQSPHFSEDVRKMQHISAITCKPGEQPNTAILEITFEDRYPHQAIIASYAFVADVKSLRYLLILPEPMTDCMTCHKATLSARHQCLKITCEDGRLIKIPYIAVQDLMPSEKSLYQPGESMGESLS